MLSVITISVVNGFTSIIIGYNVYLVIQKNDKTISYKITILKKPSIHLANIILLAYIIVAYNSTIEVMILVSRYVPVIL